MAKTHIPQRPPKAVPRLPPQFRLKPVAPPAATVDATAARDHAAALFNAGRLADAEAAFEAMVARNARDVYALYHLTLIHFLNRRYTEGLQVVDRAIAAAPSFAPNRYGRAMLLQALGRQQDALKDYDEALRLQPDYPEALLNSGVVLREMFQHHAALGELRHVAGPDGPAGTFDSDVPAPGATEPGPPLRPGHAGLRPAAFLRLDRPRAAQPGHRARHGRRPNGVPAVCRDVDAHHR